MPNILSKGALFPAQLTNEMFNLVSGKSSLAKLSQSHPIPFNGMTMFTFSMDKEVDVIAENGAKSNGGTTIAPVSIVPVKIEYGARVSDEFMYASEEAKIEMLKEFSAGFAAKTARGLDIMAFHGYNPRTKAASEVIGNNHFDSKVTQIATHPASDPDADASIEDAIGLVQGAEYDVTGMVMSPAFRTILGKQKDQDGHKLFPELAWGSNPGTINGLPVDTNSTMAFGGSSDYAIVGNFRDCFRWGFAKEIPMKVIEYGNPDNDEEAGDLQGHNQVYIRAEAYIGWGILVPEAFARIEKEA